VRSRQAVLAQLPLIPAAARRAAAAAAAFSRCAPCGGRGWGYGYGCAPQQTTYLAIAMKCIVCKQLERRLIGLGYMQSLVQAARNAVLFPDGVMVGTLGTDGVQHCFRMETAVFHTCEYLVDCLIVRKQRAGVQWHPL
jgi:hypothetical protein